MRSQGWKVNYVRNITDVDDKIIKRAMENNETPEALTNRMIQAMNEDARSLYIQSPDQEPRLTGNMTEIQNLIAQLIEKNFAYQANNGDVYYRVERFETYGKLSGQQTDALRSGVRVEVEAQKESPLDFVLWKAAKENEVSWDSLWGDGRPGWHIECSAMSRACESRKYAGLKIPRTLYTSDER